MTGRHPGKRSFLFALGVILFGAIRANAHGQSGIIDVSFEDHGKARPCLRLSVNLGFDGKNLAPKCEGGHFTIPDEIRRLNDSGAAVKGHAEVSCNGRVLDFAVPVAWVRPGNWQVGIDYPPFAHFNHHATPEKGAWVSYLSFEPQGHDGVEVQIPHSEPPAEILAQLRKEQPNATGQRAADVAFALAVFEDNYEVNRNYLLGSLRTCLARPKDSWDESGCNNDLLDYLVNLYWRGDRSLLQPLLEIASFGGDRIDGTFYADLLDRDPETALSGLSALDPETRRMVCQLAGEDGFSLDAPQFERAEESLGALGGEVASHCVSVSAIAVNKVRQHRKSEN